MSVRPDNSNHDARSDHPLWSLWLKFELAIQHICVLGICGVLLGAFWIQFGAGEYPCPLCLLQRMAMIMCAIGSIFIITHGHHTRIQGFSVIGLGYGMSVLSAVLGLVISSRQVLLHIEPGDPGYGSAVLGLHLYTWALIVFLFVLIVSGLMLVFGRDPELHYPCGHEDRQPADGPPAGSRLPWYSMCTFWIFGAIILVNAVSAFAEAGFNPFLPDNPTSYLLFEQASSP
jgi:disulfide bond formation protein DsbB